MDTILITLPESLLSLVEDQLTNNEVSSDDELRNHFIANGLTEVQAQQALAYRDRYLINFYRAGFTPIRKGKEALKFNPNTRQLERD